MTNIPDDILEKARGLVDNYGCDPDGLLVGAIAAAIQSERETMAIAFEANLNEMSQRFRAVNIAEVINQSGVDFVKLSERLAASEARVAELEAAMRFQPIDSAPRDGTQFLALQGTYHFNCWWHENISTGESYWMDESDSEPEPQYWQPLPTPPASATKGE